MSVVSKVEGIALEERFELTDHLETGLTLNLYPVGTKTALKFIVCEDFSAEKFERASDALGDFVSILGEEQK